MEPIAVQDLEGVKVKSIQCSQTYVYVITEDDRILSWGNWIYDAAKNEFDAAGF